MGGILGTTMVVSVISSVALHALGSKVGLLQGIASSFMGVSKRPGPAFGRSLQLCVGCSGNLCLRYSLGLCPRGDDKGV